MESKFHGATCTFGGSSDPYIKDWWKPKCIDPNLLADLDQALENWILTCANDFCDEREVLAAQKRIAAGGGTLAYITSLRERVHEARKV